MSAQAGSTTPRTKTPRKKATRKKTTRSTKKASPKVITHHNPATGEDLGGTTEVMDAKAVAERVERARDAQVAWAKTSFEEREEVLRAFLAEVVNNQAEICELAVKDSGKTMVDAALGEVFPVCEKVRYLLEHGAKDLEPETRSSGFLQHKAARVEYHPMGVAGVIAPWNFPFHNIYCPLVPALFAGNAVVVKVSEWTSWSAPQFIEIIHRVLRRRGHSADLVQLVTGYGETGAHLVRSGVDKIFFTGSPQNGKKVMETASEDLTPVVLELGGKDAMIVCDDADLDHALNQAMLGVFTACGQMCVGAERIYVMDEVYESFVERADIKVGKLRQGVPLEEEVDLGAMTMPRQLEILEDLVADAVAKGARVLHGGKRGTAHDGGQFFEPTLLVDVGHTMRITQEEQFGPIMVIVKVRNDEEAIRLANDCPYGLGSSVFTRDAKRAESIGERIRAGMTVVNDYGLAYMIQSLPFGGVRTSGFGRINGREGLRACCNTKAMVTDRVPLGAGVSVYPVQNATFELLENTIRTLYGDGLVSKGRGAVGALKALTTVAQQRRDSN